MKEGQNSSNKQNILVIKLIMEFNYSLDYKSVYMHPDFLKIFSYHGL